jgi:hypothetical protein
MPDSYEPSADHRPWQARRPDWAVYSQQDHPASPGRPPAPAADAHARPPGWSGHGVGQDLQPVEPPAATGLSPAGWPAPGPHPGHLPGDTGARELSQAGWPAPDPHQGRSDGHAAYGGAVERRPVYDLYQRPPAYPSQPPPPAYPSQPFPPAYPSQPPPPAYLSQPPPPARTPPFWLQGWSDYDPRGGYPAWPGHPAYATRNDGLRRLSKLTWRAAEVSAVVAVGFVALFFRTGHSTAKQVSASHSIKPSVHAAATHPAHKPHKKRRHHHRAALAPPAAAPAPAAPAPAAPAAAPAPPAPPPPPPPPVTTSGGSGGGGG